MRCYHWLLLTARVILSLTVKAWPLELSVSIFMSPRRTENHQVQNQSLQAAVKQLAPALPL